MGHVVILIGPKAVGKTTIARLLVDELGVEHVDPDLLVGSLLAAGATPDTSTGWLEAVVGHVDLRATDADIPVLVEATGAWDSDWRLRPRLEALGHRVSEVWICAPLAITLQRLRQREAAHGVVSVDEATSIYQRATNAAAVRSFDRRIDSTSLGHRASLLEQISTDLSASEDVPLEAGVVDSVKEMGISTGVTDAEHWARWHSRYDDPRSSLSRRLVAVKRRLREALSEAPVGNIQLISVCAGQGRDVIEVLARHSRATDVAGRLVELDPHLVTEARSSASTHGLNRIEVIEGDASTTSVYRGAVPANIILVCGVFGNITDADIHSTVGELRHLCAPDAIVIWTRHRRDPDLTPSIRRWFGDRGFAEIAFDTESGSKFGVGTHRLAGRPSPYRPGISMFDFVGDGMDAHH
jgi:predicted kinase